MIEDLVLRQTEARDLPEIIRLMVEDELGREREHFSPSLSPSYEKAFQEITDDRKQTLFVVEYKGLIIGTCHLTFIPSLSFKGSMRLNIENVHVVKSAQGQGVGRG